MKLIDQLSPFFGNNNLVLCLDLNLTFAIIDDMSFSALKHQAQFNEGLFPSGFRIPLAFR